MIGQPKFKPFQISSNKASLLKVQARSPPLNFLSVILEEKVSMPVWGVEKIIDLQKWAQMLI